MFAALVEQVQRLDHDDRETRLRALITARDLLDTELALIVNAEHRAGTFRQDGHTSVRGWVRTVSHGWSISDETAVIRLGELIHHRPAVGTPICEGRLRATAAGEIARVYANHRVRDLLVDDRLDFLIEQGGMHDHKTFQCIVREWETLADLDGSFRDIVRTHENRTAGVYLLDGAVHLSAKGGCLAGVEITEIFQRFLHSEYLKDVETARTKTGADNPDKGVLGRSDRQRRFDALHAIFIAAVNSDGVPRQTDPVVNLIVSEAVFEAELARQNGLTTTTDTAPSTRTMSHTTNGDPVHPAEALAAAISGHVRSVVIDDHRRIINYGRKRRLFAGAARQAVLLRSPRCIWPGCYVKAGHCEADHLAEWWRDHGTTDTVKGGPACPHHNRHKTRLAYRTEHHPNGTWHTYRPDGTEIT
jgi:hypothetical protein